MNTLDCPCQGREHIVCRPKWKVPTAKDPRVKHDTIPTLAQALRSGLTLRPADPRWAEREQATKHEKTCPTCGEHGSVASDACLTCFVKELRDGS